MRDILPWDAGDVDIAFHGDLTKTLQVGVTLQASNRPLVAMKWNAGDMTCYRANLVTDLDR